MKKKLLAVVLSVAMLASLLVPMFVISADEVPTAKISLGTPFITDRDYNLDGVSEGDFLGIPVLISDNDSPLFAARYQVLSNDGLIPHYSVYDVGTEYEYADDGVDPGDFQQQAGRDTIVLNNTVYQDPENTDKTGFQIVQDSSKGNVGISKESGTMITVFFVAPTTPGTYTFELVWMDGCDVHMVDGEKVTTPYDMTVGTSIVTYTIECPGHTGGTATCKDKAVCTICGVPYGELATNNHAGGTEVRDDYAASCNEPGFTGDIYCLGCNTKIEDGEDIPATGDHVDADGQWEHNETQHFYTCSCGTEFGHTDHTGGEATCKDKAVCSACTVAYGELAANNHAGGTEARDGYAPSCNEPGFTGDIYCLGCNTKIDDGEDIPPTGNHVDADGQWEHNETQHFHTCSCGTEFDHTGHTGGEATCKDKANCSVCSAAYGELNADNHKGTTRIENQKEATCFEEGYTGDTYCNDCNAKIADGSTIGMNQHNPASVWSTDATHHWKDCQTIGCGNLIDRAEHTGGEATCTARAVCSVCQVAYGTTDANNHKNTEVRGATSASCNVPGYTGDTWCTDCETKTQDGEDIPATGEHVDADGQWEHNETQHFHTCGCGTEFDHTGHTGGEATCKDKANCSVCSAAYGELNADNHKGTTRIEDQKEATCFEEGYTGDTYCNDCNAKIADGSTIGMNQHNPASEWSTDETHHWKDCQTIGCGNLIDRAEHTGGEATCTAKAVCSVCQVAYGTTDADNHKNTEVRGATSASCNAPGYTGDTWCTDCETKIHDGEDIPATGEHVDADGKWEHNETQHFHTCECSTEFDKEDHFGGEANCKNKAVCDVCEEEYGEIDADNHNFNGKVTITEEPTASKEGKYTVECTNGCGESDERTSKKLATSIGNDETGITIKSEEAILPEDITLIPDEDTMKEENGKYTVHFKFSSDLITTLSGKAEIAMSLEGTEDMDNIQISLLNADGSTTVVSQIKDGKLVFSADLEGTYVLSFTEKVEAEEENTVVPPSGDTMNVVAMVLVALVAVAGLVVIGKKRMAL